MAEPIRVIIDAVGVPGQGGGAVVAEMLRWLPAVHPDWQFGACLPHPDSRDYGIDSRIPNLELLSESCSGSYLSRMRWSLSGLPTLVDRWHADVLLSLSNQLPFKCSVDSIVLVHQPNILEEFRSTIDRRWRTRLRHHLLRNAILASARKARYVVVQTQQMKKGLAALDTSLQERLHIIPSGYRSNLDQWPVRDSLSQVLHTQPDQKNLVYIAYPRPHKNHIRLLNAWNQIHKRLPEWKLVFTLSPDGDYEGMGANVRRIFNLVGSAEMADSIVLTGNLNPAEVDHVLRHSEALVFPSLAESFGLPLVEAMHAQCPILVSDLPFAREIAGDAALYMDPLSEQDIADKILHLATSPEKRDALRIHSREKEPIFSYQNIARRFCDLIQECVCQASPQ